MSERKYRQRGYQDDARPDRDRTSASQAGKPPAGPRERPDGPRSPKMMGFHDVVKCHRCGTVVHAAVVASSVCTKCGAALHACASCVSFNPGARFECMQEIPARITPKDTLNVCQLFEPRTTVERETGSVRQTTARSAFDDLFNI